MTFDTAGSTWTVNGAFSAAVSVDGAALRVELRGELDVATAEHLGALLEQLRRDGHRNFLLDLTELSFCDASGLTVLLVAHRRLQADHGVLVLTGARPTVAKLLAITGLDAVLDVQVPSGPAAGADQFRTLRNVDLTG